MLAACTDPLGPRVPDLRGNWQGPDGKNGTHWERIEQCANRVVVTSPGNDSPGFDQFVVHDFPDVNGTLAGGCHDVAGPALPKCLPIKAAGVWLTTPLFPRNCLGMKPWGLVTAVTRCLLANGSLAFDWAGKKMVLHRVKGGPPTDA